MADLGLELAHAPTKYVHTIRPLAEAMQNHLVSMIGTAKACKATKQLVWVDSRREPRAPESPARGHDARAKLAVERHLRAPPPLLDRERYRREHVERVLDARRRRRIAKVLVKWCSRPRDQASWEPWPVIHDDCPQEMKCFLVAKLRWA